MAICVNTVHLKVVLLELNRTSFQYQMLLPMLFGVSLACVECQRKIREKPRITCYISWDVVFTFICSHQNDIIKILSTIYEAQIKTRPRDLAN